MVAEWTRAHQRDELIETLLEHGVPCAPVRSIEEVAADPEVERRKMLIDKEYPTRGRIRVMGSPLKLSDGDYDSTSIAPPPALGQHTDQVLAMLGIGSQERERLRREGVL